MKYSVLLSFLMISICSVSANGNADGNVLVEEDDFFLVSESDEQKSNNLAKAKVAAEFAIRHFGSYAVNFYEGNFELKDKEMVGLRNKALAFTEEAIRLDPTNAGDLLNDKDVTGEEIIKANLILTNKNSDPEQKDRAKNVIGRDMARKEAKACFRKLEARRSLRLSPPPSSLGLEK